MNRGIANRQRRRWTLRLAAIFLGLMPIIVLEFSLRLFDLPNRPPAVDPFVDLHNLQPLFNPSEDGSRLEVSNRRWNLVKPTSFPARKPKNAIRIFALGGSTTQGEPYSIDTAFPAWFGMYLQELAPDREIEVVNCGGLSYASYRVLAVLREVLEYEPDLILIYTGHNEFLEKRSYENYQDATSLWNRLRATLAELRVVQLVRLARGDRVERAETPQPKTVMPAKVEALLDFQGGLEDYRRSEQTPERWLEPITAHFRWNVNQMVMACRQAQVPVVLFRPACNLLDCPPIKFEPDPLAEASEREQFQHLWTQARSGLDSPVQAMHYLKLALEIDPRHAGAWFLLGRLQYEAGNFQQAKQSFLRSRDCDVCPLRAPGSVVESVAEIAADWEVPLIDAESFFANRSEHGIPGDRWMIDHVHPTIEGHNALGLHVLGECVQQQWLDLDYTSARQQLDSSAWQRKAQEIYANHLAALGEVYFHRGKQRLRGLLLWAQGRSNLIRSTAPDQTSSQTSTTN